MYFAVLHAEKSSLLHGAASVYSKMVKVTRWKGDEGTRLFQ